MWSQKATEPQLGLATTYCKHKTVPRIINFLKRKSQRLDIDEVIATIQDNINQERSDLHICIPELKSNLYGLIEDYRSFIKHLGSMLESKLKIKSLLLRTSPAQQSHADQSQHPYYRTASLRLDASFTRQLQITNRTKTTFS